jgi:hypothetical protein
MTSSNKIPENMKKHRMGWGRRLIPGVGSMDCTYRQVWEYLASKSSDVLVGLQSLGSTV